MFHSFPMPRTSLDSISGSLLHSYGTTTASSTSSLSIFAHASPRALTPMTFAAASIAALIFGWLTSPQLEFVPFLTIRLPLNGTSSTACGSPKSATQPTFGQTSIFSDTTPQYFEYMTVCSTRFSFVLKPRLLSVLLTASATLLAGGAESPTICNVSEPVYLPLG